MAKMNGNVAGVAAREGYEASVAVRALERAGKCPQLKGHVHELMFCDRFNANPMHLLNGEHAQLTKSATATMRDVVMTKGGKVTGHAQLKDVVSPSGVAKTLRQVRSGKYGQTAVYGTEESVKQLAGKCRQPIHSSGISSEATGRIAGKALGRMPSAGALGAAARSGGVAGAALGAGIEAISSGIDVLNGRKDVGDAIIDVGGAAAKGGIVGASSAAVGSVVAGATGSVLSAAVGTGVGTAVVGTTVGAAAVAAAPAVLAFGAACAVGSFLSDLFD